MTIEDEENRTDVPSQISEQTIPSDLVPDVPKGVDTAKLSQQKERTVPSTKTEGSVWLRYAPREPQIDESESSTEG